MIVRDPHSAQVRAILRGVSDGTRVAIGASGMVGRPRSEVLFGRGIPDAVAGRR